MNADAEPLSANDEEELLAIEALLHQLIIERNPVYQTDIDRARDEGVTYSRSDPMNRDILERRGFEFPSLIQLARAGKREEYYPVPGMYGGFDVRVFCEAGAWRLECKSWCRVVGGSGQRHEITRDGGVVLLEQGFV